MMTGNPDENGRGIILTQELKIQTCGDASLILVLHMACGSVESTTDPYITMTGFEYVGQGFLLFQPSGLGTKSLSGIHTLL